MSTAPTFTHTPLYVNSLSDLGRQMSLKDVRGRLPSDGNQAVRFQSAQICNNLPTSFYIFVDDVLMIEVYTNKTIIRYKDATGICRSLAGIYTNDGQSIRVDAVDDPCFWFSCKY